MKNTRTTLALVFLFSLACFFRFWQINSLPPGLWFDEAEFGLTSLNLLKLPHFVPFTPQATGHATLLFYLMGLSLRFFGLNPLALRLPSLFFGIASIPLFYFVARLWLTKTTSFFSAFLLATSFWHVTFSRIAFEATPLIFFSLAAFYFLLLGIKERKRLFFAISGVFLAMGMYSYLAFRIIIFIPLIYLLVKVVLSRRKELLFEASLFVTAFVLVSLPLFSYAYQHPQEFFSRTQATSVFNSQYQINRPEVILENAKKTILMFNVKGDPNARHNPGGGPMLDTISGSFFLLGLALGLLKFKQYFFLWFWLFLPLLGGILSYEGPYEIQPHALRTIGSLPAVLIFAGFGLETLANLLPIKSRLKTILFITLLLVIGFLNYQRYFIKGGQSKEFWERMCAQDTVAAQYIVQKADFFSLFVSTKIAINIQTQFLALGKNYQVFDPQVGFPFLPRRGKPLLFILKEEENRFLNVLKAYYPTIEINYYPDPFGQISFITARILR